jgi:hypothetical protein
VLLLAVKLLLAPAFVVGASLIARRFGTHVGGLVGGLPVVAGPILLVYALAHGRGFAAGAAAGTLLGLVSLIAFVLVYAHLAPRLSWGTSMLAGWLAFGAATLVLGALSPPLGVALALVAVALAAGLVLLPRGASQAREHAAPPAWDLPLRAASALSLVLALTAVSGWLGPQLSGLLAPFPVITTVLATFTHAQRGIDDLLRLLRGLISGFGAFALFCVALSLSLHHLQTGAAFALATALALLVQGLMLALVGARLAPVAGAPAVGAAASAAPALPEG